MTQDLALAKSLYRKPLLWLWIPAIFLLFHLTIQWFLSDRLVDQLLIEDSSYENVQFILIFSAFLVYASILVGFPVRSHYWLAGYVLLAVAACFYVAGEEISWGQRIFGWATSTEWKSLNDHGETNLHNTSSWIDQKPKIILQYAILFGGLLIPLLRRFKPSLLPSKFVALYPPTIFAVTALCLLLLKILKGLDDQFHYIHFQRISEVNELYMYYFVFLYALYLRLRLKNGLLKQLI